VIEVLSEKIPRSLCTLETVSSQEAPLLPPSALVGPVPVWNRPNSSE
jgi:hypothetical protein